MFFLGKGVPTSGSVRKSALQAWLNHHSMRFEHEAQLLFLLFNQMQRHHVCRDVSATVKACPKHVEAFNSMVAEPDFLQRLQRALDDPDTPESRKLVSEIEKLVRMSNAIVSLEQCLFNDVTVMHLTSADLNVVARAVKSAELSDLTDAGRTLRQCVFTSHNCKKSKTQLQLRPSASLLGSLSVITLKKIGPGECIGILGGERISLKHTGCVANEQNNNNFIAGIPWTEKLPNHAFSMKNRGSILRYANHGCFEKANSRFLASGISVEVWSKKTIPEGSEVNVHFFYGPAIIVCSCRSLLITPLLPKLTTQ